MNSTPNEKLITTKDAGEISGYTSDYLSRLARSGKIIGKRIGHSWVIDSESLEHFLNTQGNRKVDRSRQLASKRAEEYRRHRSFLHRATKKFTESLSVQESLGEHKRHGELLVSERMSDRNTLKSSLRSHTLAFSVAFITVTSGMLVARTDAIPFIANRVATAAQNVSIGFNETFGNIPSRVVTRIDAVKNDAVEISQRVAFENTIATARIAAPILSNPNLDYLQMKVSENRREPAVLSYKPLIFALTAPITFENIKTSTAAAISLVTSPERIMDSLTRAHSTVGVNLYGAISTSISSYKSSIEYSGIKTLALGAETRDTLVTVPSLVNKMNLALGEAVVGATHALIGAEVGLVYGTAVAAPAFAHATVALIGNTGDQLARATERGPALATAAFLHATAAPARIAPVIASAVFDAEYAVASRFIALTDEVTERYLALVNGTGQVAYGGGEIISNLQSPISKQFSNLNSQFSVSNITAAVQDAYLGTLGHLAAALESQTYQNLNNVMVSIAQHPQVAAVLSALSPAEQVALATYDTINGWFNSTKNTLASLFGSTPSTIVIPTLPPKTVAVATSTLKTPVRQTAPAPAIYPTYTTVVQGVSHDFVNQSLSSLRTDILATTAGLIRPVYTQTVTNAGTIQMVNKIEDLSNLIVRNGDFRGGVFDNGERVSATTGTFTNLNGGITSLASTTITGILSVSGDTTIGGSLTAGLLSVSGLSSGGVVSAPYFVATSTSATSTFAGSLNVDNGALVYATTSRYFGIGTTSPGAALAVEGSSLLGNSATAGYFTATTSTASQFPYASSTALTVSGQANIGSLIVSGTSVYTGLATFQNASTSRL
ncbi:MAG: helix-turn-helix domain-containing protein, partial [bacterium]|nr:helix-turn-helix domain-containing protein [bacterium]